MRRTILGLWLFVFATVSLIGTAHEWSGTTRAAVSRARDWISTGSPPSRESGRLLALVHVPGIVLSDRILGEAASEADRDLRSAALTDAAVVASIAALILAGGVAMNFSIRASLRAALIGTLAGPLLLGSRLDGVDVLEALLLAAATACLIRAIRSSTTVPQLGAGAFAALLLGVRLSDAFLVIWVLAFVASTSWSGADRVRGFASFLASFAPLAVAMSLAGLAAPWSFQDLWSLPPPRMIGLVLLSPSFGLAMAWPAFLVSCLVLPRFAFARRAEAALIGGLCLSLVIRSLAGWDLAALAWGPPHLLAAVPLLSWALLPLFAERAGRLGSASFRAVLFVGVAVQMLPVAYGFRSHVLPVWQRVDPEAWQTRIDDPAVAPARISWSWTRAGFGIGSGSDLVSTATLARTPDGAPPWTPDLWAPRALVASVASAGATARALVLSLLAVALGGAALLRRKAPAPAEPPSGPIRSAAWPVLDSTMPPRKSAARPGAGEAPTRDWKIHYGVNGLRSRQRPEGEDDRSESSS